MTHKGKEVSIIKMEDTACLRWASVDNLREDRKDTNTSKYSTKPSDLVPRDGQGNGFFAGQVLRESEDILWSLSQNSQHGWSAVGFMRSNPRERDADHHGPGYFLPHGWHDIPV